MSEEITDKQTENETLPPNLQFVGRRKLTSGEYVETEAPSVVNSGMRKIKLPPSDAQKAGFYLEAKDARVLLAEYPHLYKTPKMKDGKPLPAFKKDLEEKPKDTNKPEVEIVGKAVESTEDSENRKAKKK